MNDYSIALSKFGFGALRLSTFLVDPATDGLQHVRVHKQQICLLARAEESNILHPHLLLLLLVTRKYISHGYRQGPSLFSPYATLLMRGSIKATMVQSLVVGPEVQLISMQHQVEGQLHRKVHGNHWHQLEPPSCFLLSDP